MLHLTTLRAHVERLVDDLRREEDGFSTAELLGNAALGVVALVVIWAGLKSVGLDVVDMVRTELLSGQ